MFNALQLYIEKYMDAMDLSCVETKEIFTLADPKEKTFDSEQFVFIID